MICVLDQYPVLKADSEKGDYSSPSVDGHIDDEVLHAAIVALTAFFRFIENDAVTAVYSIHLFNHHSINNPYVSFAYQT